MKNNKAHKIEAFLGLDWHIWYLVSVTNCNVTFKGDIRWIKVPPFVELYRPLDLPFI